MNFKNVHFEKLNVNLLITIVVKEYDHWMWLIRPSQPTLGVVFFCQKIMF